MILQAPSLYPIMFLNLSAAMATLIRPCVKRRTWCWPLESFRSVTRR